VKSSSKRSSGGRVWANSSMEGSYVEGSFRVLAVCYDRLSPLFLQASICLRDRYMHNLQVRHSQSVELVLRARIPESKLVLLGQFWPTWKLPCS
jgi:hypothetical protein